MPVVKDISQVVEGVGKINFPLIKRLSKSYRIFLQEQSMG